MKSILLSSALLLTQAVSAQYTKLFDLSNSSSQHASGSLIYDGTFLYGMTEFGGSKGNGTVFKIKPDGSGFTDLLDFDGANGKEPKGALVTDGTWLYGMTWSGGTSGEGVAFKIKKDGSGYTKLLDFNGTNGAYPYGSLTLNGSVLYGMTQQGGATHQGVIFRINTDGSGYTDMFDFDGTNGFSPESSLLLDGGMLYGMTKGGGTGMCAPDYCGVIFRIGIDGSNFTKIFDFRNDTASGSNPKGDLVTDGTWLYGTTFYGGSKGLGTAFRIGKDGSGFKKLVNFSSTTPARGEFPVGALSLLNGYLYGMTSSGGALGDGIIFRIKPDGGAYQVLYEFNDGNQPLGSFVSDGTYLYATTYYGGTGCVEPHAPQGCGIIFRYQYSTATGVAENGVKEEFSLFPNPTSGIFNIGNIEKDVKVCVFNDLGSCIYQKNLRKNENATIDLSPFSKGIYVVELNSEDGKTVKKITVQ
jgi:uncharacterized repeat protein (TIGR03803 family)